MRRSLQIREGLVDFSSNDYLGLARSPQVILKLGSTGSRLLTGNSREAERLERDLAVYYGYEAGLLFNCGYMANMGLLSTLKGTLLYDAQVHTSMKEGIRLSQAKAYPFRHSDTEHLEARLKHKEGPVYICFESIDSTDGSIAPINEILRLSQDYGAHLIVDEAHAVGVFGEGLVKVPVFAKIATFGKALGAFGAIVLSSDKLKHHLINTCRPFIYTTALPYYALEAIRQAHALLPELEKERRHLFDLIHLCAFSKTPIQPLFVPGEVEVKELSLRLASCGFDVRPLISPTVRRGFERLRICLHAFNTESEVLRLKEALS